MGYVLLQPSLSLKVVFVWSGAQSYKELTREVLVNKINGMYGQVTKQLEWHLNDFLAISAFKLFKAVHLCTRYFMPDTGNPHSTLIRQPTFQSMVQSGLSCQLILMAVAGQNPCVLLWKLGWNCAQFWNLAPLSQSKCQIPLVIASVTCTKCLSS